MVSIGIDIGTSNTVVAKVDGQGGVAIHKFEDSDLLPSVIHVEETLPKIGRASCRERV